MEKLLSLDALRENEVVPVEIAGRSILLALVEGRVYAFDAMCTHGSGYLGDGCLEGYEISCPLHDGCFDIRNGNPTREPAVDPLRCYPIRIEGREVFVDLEPSSV